MIKLFTSRHKLTTLEISLLGLLGVLITTLSGLSLKVAKENDFDLLEKATKNTAHAFQTLRETRSQYVQSDIDSINDPAYSGLIGIFHSPITTGYGDLEAKQSSINPNWAALVIRFLQQAGVKPGDPVAIGMTGSFPALNIAVIMAVEAYGAKPFWVISQSSTAWGANVPSFTFLEMERILKTKELIARRAIGSTLGGNNNAGAELDNAGRQLLLETIQQHEVPFINAIPLSAAINSIMQTFSTAAKGHRYPLFINIGSGYTNLGTMNSATILKNGLNGPKILTALNGEPVSGVATEFLKQGAQVLNLYDIVDLARKNGFPIAPAVTPLPATGKMFYSPRYPVILHIILLLFYGSAVYAVAQGYTNFLTKNPRKQEML